MSSLPPENKRAGVREDTKDERLELSHFEVGRLVLFFTKVNKLSAYKPKLLLLPLALEESLLRNLSDLFGETPCCTTGIAAEDTYPYRAVDVLF